MSAANAGSQWVSLRVLSWPFRHIRWKIVLPYVLLTALLALIGSYVFTELTTSSLEERFQNQLKEAGGVVSDKVVRKERDHLETVRAVAFTDGVAGAVQGHDRGVLDSLVQPIATTASARTPSTATDARLRRGVMDVRSGPDRRARGRGFRTRRSKNFEESLHQR